MNKIRSLTVTSKLNLLVHTLKQLIPNTRKGSTYDSAEHDFVNVRADDFGRLGVWLGWRGHHADGADPQ
jgi:hypothetical protein